MSVVQKVEFSLNPSKESDNSKVVLTMSDKTVRLKWFDCTDNTSHGISMNEDGLIKLDRMKLAIEIAEKHIRSHIKS